MKSRIAVLISSLALAGTFFAQSISQASFMKPSGKSDVVVPFRVTDPGVETPIEWGLDLAWLEEANIKRGVAFAGKELIDIVRTSYTATESVEGGELSSAQIDKIRERVNIIKRNLKSDVSININHDHGGEPQIDKWYNASGITSDARGERWAKLIDLAIKKYAELGITNLVSISPFNEPDYGWGQGLSNATRKNDFLGILKALRPMYPDVRLCGGNTLNDDYALDWWNHLREYLDEGNTHQLAGSFDNYANFFKTVREAGHHASADELHNTMEAMVGVEYGMQTGIWWGTCEYSRSQFMKATNHANPGKRLAYAEHRGNWTASSVYRHTDGSIQVFGGTSERQAVATKYNFISLDHPAWFNGNPGREYMMSLPGGTGYQNGQSNAETVVDVQFGTDIMPIINGTYKIMNVNSKKLLGFASAPPADKWTAAVQRDNENNASYLEWIVEPVPTTIGDDFSYYKLMLNTGDTLLLDILNWNLAAGADVGAFKGGLGTNEQWYLQYAGEGSFYIRSRFSAKCLELSNRLQNTAVKMADFTGDKKQQWRFIPTSSSAELTAPKAPTNLTATAQGSSVRLEWQPSTSKDVASYTILRSDDGTDFHAIANQLTETTFVDCEAKDGVTHTYKVYAVDNCYNYSEHTASVTTTVSGEPDCVMHLPFDYTFNDTTLNANHSAIYGKTQWVKSHVGDAALRMNGSDNYIQLPYTIANHQSLTVSCWVYWRGGDNWQRVWDFGNGTNHYMFFSPQSDSGMRFAIKNGGDEQQIRLSRILGKNRWIHVALTIGSEGACLYVDGEIAGENKNINISPADFRPVLNYIGRSQFYADPTFNGYIDDFRIYNYVLSSSDISALIEEADAIHAPKSDNTIDTSTHDLSGRLLPNTSRHRGIVIRNGKKVTVK